MLANIRYQVIDWVSQKSFLDEYTLNQADEPYCNQLETDFHPIKSPGMWKTII